MIIDTLINFLIWIYQNTLLKILPNDFSFFSFQDYLGYLNSARENLVPSLAAINQFFAIDVLLYCLAAMIAGELLLLGVKIVMYVINVFRGAGA